MELASQEGEALGRLAGRLSVSYLDHHTSSKDFIRETYLGERPGLHPPAVEISTCLRLERYFIEQGSGGPIDQAFHRAEGAAAVRRLLSIAVGLHSEIVGEREILNQVRRAVELGVQQGSISTEDVPSFQAIIGLAEKIRSLSGITVEENYSTVGAQLFRRTLEQMKSPTIMVIGAGYMVREFLMSLAEFATKVVWANRTFARIKQASEALRNVRLENIVCTRLEDCARFFPLVDGVFAAVPGKDFAFSDADAGKLPGHALIVDVSYPPVFPETIGRQLISIANTGFAELAQRRASRAQVHAAQHAIEQVTRGLRSCPAVGLAA